MIGMGREGMRTWRAGRAKAAAFAVLALLSACAGNDRFGGLQPEQTAAPPPPAPAPAPSPPPIDLGGRWKLAASAGASCFMMLGDVPGAAQGTIAPEGGCPGSFFTSRKWTFENDRLVIRNHKGEPLAQLSYSGDHFQGQDNSGGALSLAR